MALLECVKGVGFVLLLAEPDIVHLVAGGVMDGLLRHGVAGKVVLPVAGCGLVLLGTSSVASWTDISGMVWAASCW